MFYGISKVHLQSMVMEKLSSAQNPKIKELLSIQEKSRLRRSKGIFAVEGRREIVHCIESGFPVRSIFCCPDIAGKDDIDEVLQMIEARQAEPGDCKVFELTRDLYSKVAYREGTEGIIALMKCRDLRLEDIVLSENPLVIVLESVEKPGNLGAVLRSADASGADAIIVCDPLTDLYNPNLIRSSIGAVFTKQVCAASSEDTIAWLKKHGIQILTAQLQDSKWYYDTDMKGATAIVMGTEATGLTDLWRKNADSHIKIPMLGKLDSLNVSVSAAILLFEAVRQRQSK